MLIGAELFFELLLTERVMLKDCYATLWNTKLGWIVTGAFDYAHRTTTLANVACIESSESNLDKMVQRFWDQEETANPANVNAEDQQCLDHFARTHRREEGRFVVRLPFRENLDQLGESRNMAEIRFYQLEKRLKANGNLKMQYSAFMNEYMRLGHCVKVEDFGSPGFYLPHHAILKPSSSTTKLRVVFDASSRSDTNVSLNDVLMKGPTIQDTLASIVLRARKYKFLFSADVIKMFRQIRVDDKDTCYLRVLYREDPQAKLDVFELKTVTYGTSCAPFCAMTILAKLFIQQLWSLELPWDEPLPTELEADWRRFKNQLKQINEIKIVRCVVAEDAETFEVHGFSDASKKAYGACVYLRSLRSDGTSVMHLISSKTRVSPLPTKPGSKKSRRPYTAPRAELCGALLLSRLVTNVLKAIDMKIDKVLLWCDSQIVLCWLKRTPDSLELFVGSRVREIHLLTNAYEWRYVNTNDNPADLASTPLELQYSHSSGTAQ
ncbi:uncharacterized protein LOC134221540 [Armigeres subalbatus]|uniref:uncharacterized protein LOC134221540 n=1 Tax=Armigeres subalbatus TaxID=124917 RepID=UPI002ED55C24